jgi:hypothetical protein
MRSDVEDERSEYLLFFDLADCHYLPSRRHSAAASG